MCVAGGKRCEYSDAISNVRRKVRSKHRNNPPYDLERQVSDAVRRFQETNPEMVKAHLPAKMGFQYQPPKRSLPDSITEQMGAVNFPVAGVEAEDKDSFFKCLYDRRQKWMDALDDDEDSAVQQYAMSAFEYVNPYLRRHGYREWAKREPGMLRGGTLEEYTESYVKPLSLALDSALRKAEAPEGVERTYRFYRVPPGVTPAFFIKNYFQPGSGFKDRGFLSTSADPEYIAAHILSRSGGRNNKGYIVMEMYSQAGASLQSTPTTDSGWVQSVEAEILLPRNTGFHIIDSGKKDFLFAKDRPDLEERFQRFGGKRIGFQKDSGIKLPVVRLVDNKLMNK